MTNPLFSIITITLNNLTGLEKTFCSIQKQSYQNYEWIIIDGASIDGTSDFLNHHRIPHISEKDTGIYDAMNKGINHATGEYFLFLNAGDILENNDTLQQISDYIKNNSYDFIYGDSKEKQDNQILFKRSRSHNLISQGMFTHHQAMLYNRTKIQPYNTHYKIAADYDLTWRILNKSNDILYIPLPICLFEEGGISQQQILRGRIEQFKIRKTFNVSFVKNLAIFIIQTMAYTLRRLCPPIYWFLKRR